MTTISPAPPGIAFVFDTAIRSLGDQMRWIDSLDTKAGVLMAAEAVIAGLVLSRGSILLETPAWVGVAVALLLLTSLLLALLSFSTRRFQLAPNLQALVAAANTGSAESLRWGVLPAVLEALEINEPKVAQKADLLFYSGCSLMLATATFGASFILQLLTSGMATI